MTQVSDTIKKIQNQGKVVKYKDTDLSVGVQEYYCSTHIRKEKMQVRGEWSNPKTGARKAVIVFLDSKTGEVKGRKIYHILINRKAGD